jgi:hypothetical protein
MKLKDKQGLIFFRLSQMIKKQNLKKKFVNRAGTGKLQNQMVVQDLLINQELPFNARAIQKQGRDASE